MAEPQYTGVIPESATRSGVGSLLSFLTGPFMRREVISPEQVVPTPDAIPSFQLGQSGTPYSTTQVDVIPGEFGPVEFTMPEIPSTTDIISQGVLSLINAGRAIRSPEGRQQIAEGAQAAAQATGQSLSDYRDQQLQMMDMGETMAYDPATGDIKQFTLPIDVAGSVSLGSLAVPAVNLGPDAVALGMARKTRGGSFAPQRAPDRPRFSPNSLPETLNAMEDRLQSRGVSTEQKDIIVSKAKKFFETEFGTESDRVRQMMREGKIRAPMNTRPDQSVDGVIPAIQIAVMADIQAIPRIAEVREARNAANRLRDYEKYSDTFNGFESQELLDNFKRADKKLQELTRKGTYNPDVEPTPAMQSFEGLYDRSTGIRARFVSNVEDIPSFRQEDTAREDLVTRLAEESAYPNPPPIDVIKVSQLEERFPGLDLTDESLRRAVQNQEPIYDLQPDTRYLDFLRPGYLADNIADLELTTDEARKMSFPEMVRSAQRNQNIKDAFNEKMATANKVRSFLDDKGGNDYGRADEAIRKELLADVPTQLKFEGLEEIVATGDKSWYRITDPQSTILEGKMMGHSVGGYADKGREYGSIGGHSSFLEGDARVYTLRDRETGDPTITVEVDFSKEKPLVNQIKSVTNKAPDDPMLGLEDVFTDLFALFEKLDVDAFEGRGGAYSFIRAYRDRTVDDPIGEISRAEINVPEPPPIDDVIPDEGRISRMFAEMLGDRRRPRPDDPPDDPPDDDNFAEGGIVSLANGGKVEHGVVTL
jgi:hypothetical protein